MSTREHDVTERVVSDANALRILSVSLVVVDGPARGRRVAVEGGVARVGAAPGNHLRLNDPTVSRVHCEVRVRPDALVIRDCGSTNGTFVEGVRVREGEVRPGAIVRAGASAFRIEETGGDVFLPISSRTSFGECVGTSLEMRRLYSILERVAGTSSTVLIEGETGTGKDVVARSLHAASERRGPYVPIDCGAIPVTLIESELFGHVRGAFSGALADRLLARRPYDRRADVYSAAVVLWELLTSRRYFELQTSSPAALVAAVLEHQPKPPSAVEPTVPRALDEVVLRGLARDPRDRYATALEMAAALEAAIVPSSQRAIADWVSTAAGDTLRERAKGKIDLRAARGLGRHRGARPGVARRRARAIAQRRSVLWGSSAQRHRLSAASDRRRAERERRLRASVERARADADGERHSPDDAPPGAPGAAARVVRSAVLLRSRQGPCAEAGVPVTRARVSHLVIASLLGLTAGDALAADPPDRVACGRAYEQAQRLRRAEQLRAARAELLVCSRAECPAWIRRDCLPWLGEVDVATPTVVLAVREPGGDMAKPDDVRVTIDGAIVTERWSDGAIPLDPGDHVVVFESQRGDRVEQRFSLREGERDRKIEVTFAARSPAVAPRAHEVAGDHDDRRKDTAQPVPPLVYALGAGGVVATAVGAFFQISGMTKRSDLYDCKPSCAPDAVDDARTTLWVGNVALGVGALALAGAVWLYLARPSVVVDR